MMYCFLIAFVLFTSFVVAQEKISPPTEEPYPVADQLPCSSIQGAKRIIDNIYPDNRNSGCFKKKDDWTNGYCLASCDQGNGKKYYCLRYAPEWGKAMREDCFDPQCDEQKREGEIITGNYYDGLTVKCGTRVCKYTGRKTIGDRKDPKGPFDLYPPFQANAYTRKCTTPTPNPTPRPPTPKPTPPPTPAPTPDCICANFNTISKVLKIIPTASGSVEMLYTNPYQCDYSNSLTVDGQSQIKQQVDGTVACKSEVSLVTTGCSLCNLANVAAGTVKKFSVTQTVELDMTSAPAGGRLISTDYHVPFDGAITIAVKTGGTPAAAISNRKVTIEIASSVAARFGNVMPFLSKRRALGNAADVKRGLKHVFTTGADGLLSLYVFWPTHLTSSAANVPQSFEVKFTVDDDPMFDYNNCGAVCSTTATVTHNQHLITQPAHTFIDLSSVTVRGTLSFIGFPTCGATDVIVEGKDNAGMLLYTGDVADDGTWAVSVPQNTYVKVYFRREVAPDYIYVNKKSGKSVDNPYVEIQKEVTVGKQVVDILMPFELATSVTATGFGLASVRVAVQSGLCEFPLVDANQVTVTGKSKVCGSGVVKLVEKVNIDVTGHVTLPNVPPVLFDIDLSVTGNSAELSAARRFFTTYEPQQLDARLPELEATRADAGREVPTAVAQANLGSVLRDSLRLLLPFDSAVKDASPAAHRVGYTKSEMPLEFDDQSDMVLGRTAAVFKNNGTGIGFGKNHALNFKDAATISFWLTLENADDGATLFQLNPLSEENSVPFRVTVAEDAQHTTKAVLQLSVNGDHDASTMIARDDAVHVAIVVESAQKALIYVDGALAASGASANSMPTGVETLFGCSGQRFQYNCVREFLIGTSSFDGAALFDGRLDDFAVWSRALSAQDVAFVHALGMDGIALDTQVKTKFPAFVYRSRPQLAMPPLDIRFVQPPGATGAMEPTVEEKLAGKTLPPNMCESTEEMSNGNKFAQQNQIYPVQEGGAVSFLTEIWEQYGTKKCFQVRGEVHYRSTFTQLCNVTQAEMANDDFVGCKTVMTNGDWGYAHFFAQVTKPVLIPINKTNSDGSSELHLNEYTFDYVTPFLGSFRVSFNNDATTAIKKYFHVSGSRGPDFPSIYSLPIDDVPLLRLYKPPGDQSTAFLERSWAESVQISFGREGGNALRANMDNDFAVGAAVKATTCAGVAGGGGGPVIVLATVSSCIDNSVEAFVTASLNIGTEGTFTHSISLGEAFDSETVTRFETTVNNNAVGKWGDIVVTVGMTMRITDSFLNEFRVDNSACRIVQTYSPEWQAVEAAMDSLQVTPRVALPSKIANFKRLAEVINRDCGEALEYEKLDQMPVKRPAAASRDGLSYFNKCVNKTINGDVPITDEDEKKGIWKKYQQAADGVERWSNILQNWEAITCQAYKEAGVDDPYVLYDGADPCNTVNSTGVEVGKLNIWNLLSSNNNDDFEARKAAAQGVIDGILDRKTALVSLCGGKASNYEPLDVTISKIDWIGLGIKCGEVEENDGSYKTVEMQQGVFKLEIQGGTSFEYATSGTVTRTETYSLGAASEYSVDGDIGGGTDVKTPFGNVEWDITVGAGYTRSNSMETGGEVSRSESTTVGFILSDEDILDSIGVQVYTDPVYGTPVFVTTGGWTMCPYEPGTNARQAFSVFPRTSETEPIDLYSDDPNGLISLDLRAQMSSIRLEDDGYKWVYDIQVAFDQDLTVKYKDVQLGIGGNVPVQFSNDEIVSFGPITVKRGRKFSYTGVYLYIISECDDAVLTDKGVDEGVWYNLHWKPQCAPSLLNTTTVEGGIFPTERQFFVISSETPSPATIEVVNPDPIGAPWTLVDGEFVIKAQYRAIGEQTQWKDLPGGVWPRLKYCKNAAPAGIAPSCYEQCTDPDTPKCCAGAFERCSVSQACCGGVGLKCNLLSNRCEYETSDDSAEITFDADALNVEEGTYEIRTVTVCEREEQAGELLEGRIDRSPPTLFGAIQNPADRLWWPGDEISLRFIEALECSRPHRFEVAIKLGENSVKVENAVDVLCEGNKIEFAFSRTLIQSPDELIGQQVTISLTNVEDLALNKHRGAAEWTFKVGAFDESKTTVRLSDVRVPASLVDGTADENAAVIAALLGDEAPEDQIEVKASAAMRRRAVDPNEPVLSYDVVIRPAADVQGGKSAVRLAKTAMSSDNAVLEYTRVEMEAPGRPASSTDGTDANGGEGGLSGLEIGLIIAGAVVYVLCMLGIIAFVVLRRGKGESETSGTTTPSESGKTTEMQQLAPQAEPTDFFKLSNQGSRRSRRSNRSRRSRRVPSNEPTNNGYAAPPAALNTYSAPPVQQQYGAAPPAVRKSSRRKSSRRRQADASGVQSAPLV